MDINFALAILITTLAGLSTGIGSIISFFIRTPKHSYLAVMLGFSAGIMIYMSFTELLGTAITDIGFLASNIAFFIGILLIAIIDIVVPHEYEEEQAAGIPISTSETEKEKKFRLPLIRTTPSQSSLKRSGVLLAVGIAIHNFPEGLVTFTSVAAGDLAFGVLIAAAIAIHNIPEGIAISMPIYHATGSRRRAFGYSFLAGIAEPIGALIGYAILRPFLTPELLLSTLAFAAGVMVYISLDEILPLAFRYGKEHHVIIGIVTGMLVMAISLFMFT